MNFLSHATPYFDQPFLAVSTAIPDWLSVVDRKIRARERRVRDALAEYADSPTGEVARGILQHIEDDRWFHQTRAFTELNLQLAVSLRDRLPGDDGFRPMFVGHIVIEILLDALLIRDDRSIGEAYYQLVEETSAEEIQDCVNRITSKPTSQLAPLIRRFAEAKFLYDYLDDEPLLMRLNQVMKRVRLNPLPQAILPWIQAARDLVESRRVELLTRPDGKTDFPSHVQIPRDAGK